VPPAMVFVCGNCNGFNAAPQDMPQA